MPNMPLGDHRRPCYQPSTNQEIVMELIVMILAPLPIGFFVRNRLADYIVYIAIHAFVFTFQSLVLVLEWARGSQEAFGGSFPHYEMSEVWGYGAVNLLIYLVGLGLVTLGYRLGSMRRAKQTEAVSLDPVG
jgi:hypothetical protein